MGDSAIDSFEHEATELLNLMEESLLRLENVPDDEALINAIFRAAHTIKGTGGVFGFDNIVQFTHIVENVLDRVRASELNIDSELIAVLLNCRDHIGTLVRLAIDGNAELDEEVFETLDMAVVDGYVLKDVSPDELNRAIRMIAQGQVYIHAEVTRALLTRNRSPQPKPDHIKLTPRESEVLQLLATSATYQEIGKQLSISEETVRSHAKGILAKLGQPNRTMAVVTAVKLGLIDLE